MRKIVARVIALLVFLVLTFPFVFDTDESDQHSASSNCMDEQQLTGYFKDHAGVRVIGRIGDRAIVARFINEFATALGVRKEAFEARTDRLVVLTHPTQPMYGVFEFIGNCYSNKYHLISPELYHSILAKIGFQTA